MYNTIRTIQYLHYWPLRTSTAEPGVGVWFFVWVFFVCDFGGEERALFCNGKSDAKGGGFRLDLDLLKERNS